MLLSRKQQVLKMSGMSEHSIDYRGYRLEIQPMGPGLKVIIWSGAKRAKVRTASVRDKSEEKVIAEAKSIVDAHIQAKAFSKKR